MKLRVIIADDEPLAREKLRGLLRAEPEVELVAEAVHGLEAVAVIQRENPDLLFLDVQMPGLDGFGVLSELDLPAPPMVVFVTAFDQFALKAFEVHAIDYLLKPYDAARFRAALEKARRQADPNAASGLRDRMSALFEDLGKPRPGEKSSERIAIKGDGRVRLFRVDQIDWIEAANNYVSLHIGKETLLHRETMTAMETRLPADRFARIARSTMVNLDRIRELQPLFHGDFVVIPQDGAKLTLSRKFRAALSHWLG